MNAAAYLIKCALHKAGAVTPGLSETSELALRLGRIPMLRGAARQARTAATISPLAFNPLVMKAYTPNESNELADQLRKIPSIPKRAELILRHLLSKEAANLQLTRGNVPTPPLSVPPISSATLSDPWASLQAQALRRRKTPTSLLPRPAQVADTTAMSDRFKTIQSLKPE